MTIPTSSNFPKNFDSDDNLFLVHDSLRLTLAEDYNPGDKTITVDGDPDVFLKFPPTGIITLTEQCSPIDQRAISFYYGAKGAVNTFEKLELIPGFPDVVKPKRITHVTQNVMAQHHNYLKDAVIAIQRFLGVKGTTDAKPLGETIEGRINFLRKLVLTPKAWFSVNKTVGLIPLEVEFTEQAFRTGDGSDVTFIWDFGDQTCSAISIISTISGISIISGGSCISTLSTISVTSVVPISETNVSVIDIDGGTLRKTYTKAGKYSVKLTVKNKYGEDTITFEDLINARIPAPDEAVINFVPRSGQITTDGLPTGGPYTTPPRIRAAANTFIDMEIPSGVNPNTGRSYGGEELEDFSPVDPIVEYTWSLADDLEHQNLPTARAGYSIGGIYDLILRVDTHLGAYRITSYEDAIDIIERTNMWLWVYGVNQTTVNAYEYGLLSETFKKSNAGFDVIRDNSFLTGTNNEAQAKREFERNTGFTIRGTTPSGSNGTAYLFWAGGGTLASQKIKASEYNGFLDTYTDPNDFPVDIVRPWNWVFLSSGTKAYFFLGADTSPTPFTNTTEQSIGRLDLSSLTYGTDSVDISFYKNGANELIDMPSGTPGFDGGGEPLYGRFAVYRSAWKDNVGYFLRNDNVGSFFKIKNFYRTEGTVVDPFLSIKKLPDMAGPVKVEGQLVALSNGVYFFNNSGSISAYNDSAGVWETGGPSSNSVSFRSIQDVTTSGFDNPANTLLATSDNDKIVYLSFDYSPNAFVKFNAQDLTFTNMGSRPTGTQWIMGVF